MILEEYNVEICLNNNALLVCLVALKHRLSDFSYYLLILKACEKKSKDKLCGS